MAEDAATWARSGTSFGPFQLYPTQQLLCEGETRIPLGSRAINLLIALVDRAGELVTKDELIALVWPNLFVEEANLRVTIGQLRRALRDGQSGNRYIATDAGRGYRFVAPVNLSRQTISQQTIAVSQPAIPPRIDNLPGALTQVIGRDTLVATLAAQLPQRRFITLVGPAASARQPRGRRRAGTRGFLCRRRNIARPDGNRRPQPVAEHARHGAWPGDPIRQPHARIARASQGPPHAAGAR